MTQHYVLENFHAPFKSLPPRSRALIMTSPLWLDFRMIDENELHGMGRRIENASEGIILQIEKKAESPGALNAYIYLIMDAQLNIQSGAYVSAIY